MNILIYFCDSCRDNQTINTMDDQRDARGTFLSMFECIMNANKQAIWLGHLLMQSFLARWLVRSDLPTDQLQVCQQLLAPHQILQTNYLPEPPYKHRAPPPFPRPLPHPQSPVPTTRLWQNRPGRPVPVPRNSLPGLPGEPNIPNPADPRRLSTTDPRSPCFICTGARKTGNRYGVSEVYIAAERNGRYSRRGPAACRDYAPANPAGLAGDGELSRRLGCRRRED